MGNRLLVDAGAAMTILGVARSAAGAAVSRQEAPPL